MTKNYYNYFDYLLKGELNTIEELSPYLIKLEANGLHTLKDVSNKTLKGMLNLNGLSQEDCYYIIEILNKRFILFKKGKISNKNSGILIDTLDFSIPLFNLLKRSGINTIDDLVSKSKYWLKSMRNMGEKNYQELIKKVHQQNLTFIDERMDEEALNTDLTYFGIHETYLKVLNINKFVTLEDLIFIPKENLDNYDFGRMNAAIHKQINAVLKRQKEGYSSINGEETYKRLELIMLLKLKKNLLEELERVNARMDEISIGKEGLSFSLEYIKQDLSIVNKELNNNN